VAGYRREFDSRLDASAAERISLNSSTRQGGPASGIQALDPGR
jgi:hypothetical protein